MSFGCILFVAVVSTKSTLLHALCCRPLSYGSRPAFPQNWKYKVLWSSWNVSRLLCTIWKYGYYTPIKSWLAHSKLILGKELYLLKACSVGFVSTKMSRFFDGSALLTARISFRLTPPCRTKGLVFSGWSPDWNKTFVTKNNSSTGRNVRTNLLPSKHNTAFTYSDGRKLMPLGWLRQRKRSPVQLIPIITNWYFPCDH